MEIGLALTGQRTRGNCAAGAHAYLFESTRARGALRKERRGGMHASSPASGTFSTMSTRCFPAPFRTVPRRYHLYENIEDNSAGVASEAESVSD